MCASRTSTWPGRWVGEQGLGGKDSALRGHSQEGLQGAQGGVSKRAHLLSGCRLESLICASDCSFYQIVHSVVFVDVTFYMKKRLTSTFSQLIRSELLDVIRKILESFM